MSNLGDTIKGVAAAAAIAPATVIAPAQEPLPPGGVGVAAPAAEKSPLIKFDPSQRALFDDETRIIAVNWHRQKGKDFTAAAKAVDHAIRTGQSWYIVALTQAQADETFAKAKKIAAAFKALLKIRGNITESSEDFLDRDREIDHLFRCTARTLHLPNGGRIVSLPGRDPDTLAGRSGNMILTEFGLYPNGGYAHWEVLFPITTRGGFKLIVISTPRGKNTKFYEVISNPDGDYSVHLCDIRRSVFEDGYQIYGAKGEALPIGTDAEKEAAIATLRRLYKSEAKWPREYGCEFTGDMSALITWAEIERMASLGVGRPFFYKRIDSTFAGVMDLLSLLGHAPQFSGKRLGLGWDVARHSHLSVLWVNLLEVKRPDHLAALVVMDGVPFKLQRGVVRLFMKSSRNAVGFGDATGLGMDSNEQLHEEFGDRWTPYTFTAPAKREIASALKTAATDAAQTIPKIDGEYGFVATDLYALQKDDTGANLVITESKNPKLPESHCDIAFAGGLARLASAANVVVPLPRPLADKPEGM